MGESKRRGNFEQRKAGAIAVGRVKKNNPFSKGHGILGGVYRSTFRTRKKRA